MADENSGNFTKNFILILIIIILFVIFYIISPKEPGIKTTYWMVIGLVCLSIINIYLSIYYYIKLRSQRGTQGPRGPRGNKGQRGDSGVCAASETCQIDKNDCRDLLTNIRNEYWEDTDPRCYDPNSNYYFDFLGDDVGAVWFWLATAFESGTTTKGNKAMVRKFYNNSDQFEKDKYYWVMPIRRFNY